MKVLIIDEVQYCKVITIKGNHNLKLPNYGGDAPPQIHIVPIDAITQEIAEGILLGTCNNTYGENLIPDALSNLGLVFCEQDYDFSKAWEAIEQDLAEHLAELEIQECPTCNWWCQDVHHTGESEELVCSDCEVDEDEE